MIRKIEKKDQVWISRFLEEHWGSPQIVTRGKIHAGDSLPGYIAELDNKKVGLITYTIVNCECEIVSLNSINERKGIGTKLITSVINTARDHGCKRVWLVTTNENIAAIHFYQHRGFTLRTLYKNAIEHSRKLKPSIPLLGMDNIPIRDELEFEYLL